MTQNLVPLYIDKISGDLVASKNPNAGNSGNIANQGYEHIQLTPLLTWIIQHNANTKRLICQVFSQNDEMIFADEIKIQDSNTIVISFNNNQSGSAKIVFF